MSVSEGKSNGANSMEVETRPGKSHVVTEPPFYRGAWDHITIAMPFALRRRVPSCHFSGILPEAKKPS